jgi:hypothetical protein
MQRWQNKERILKSSRESALLCTKQVNQKKTDPTSLTLNARRSWTLVFQALMQNNWQPILPYST